MTDADIALAAAQAAAASATTAAASAAYAAESIDTVDQARDEAQAAASAAATIVSGDNHYMFVVVNGIPYYDPAGPATGEAGADIAVDGAQAYLTILPVVDLVGGAPVLVY